METLSVRMPPSNASVPENISVSLTTYSTLPHVQFCPHCDKCHLFMGRIHCIVFLPLPTNKFYYNWLGSAQCITTVTLFCYGMLHHGLRAAILRSLILLCLSSGATSPSLLLSLNFKE